MTIVIIGLPGSGKTFFAKHLAKAIKCVHISSDELRSIKHKRGIYGEQTKLEIYNLMLTLMELAINYRQDTILDATFYKENIRKLFCEKAGELNSPFYFIEIKAEDATIKERLSKTRPDSEADYSTYLKLKSQFEPVQQNHLTLYSDRQSIDEMLNVALTYIHVTNGESGVKYISQKHHL